MAAGRGFSCFDALVAGKLDLDLLKDGGLCDRILQFEEACVEVGTTTQRGYA